MSHDRLLALALVALACVPAPGCKGMFRRGEEKPAAVAPGAPAPAPAPAAAVPPAVASAAPVEIQVVRIRVPDMEDQCCADKVEEILAGVPGVSSAHVDMPSKVATVSCNRARTSPEQLVEVLRRGDWQASLVMDGK